MLSTSADNTLLDLHNSLYPTQPHSLIANYPICCIFCPVLSMFLKGWCGQPKIFFFFKTPMRRLDCFCPSGRTNRININRIIINPNDYYNAVIDYYNPVIDYYNPLLRFEPCLNQLGLILILYRININPNIRSSNGLL